MNEIEDMAALLDAIDAHAEASQDACAFILAGRRVSYSALRDLIDRCRADFSAAGLTVGHSLHAPDLDEVSACAAFLACASLGATWCVSGLPPERAAWLWPTHRLDIARDAVTLAQVAAPTEDVVARLRTKPEMQGGMILCPHGSAPSLIGVSLSERTVFARAAELLAESDAPGGSTLVLHHPTTALSFWLHLLASLRRGWTIRFDGSFREWVAAGVARYVGPLAGIPAATDTALYPVSERMPRAYLLERAIPPSRLRQVLDRFDAVHLTVGTIETGPLGAAIVARKAGAAGVTQHHVESRVACEIVALAGPGGASAAAPGDRPGLLHVRGAAVADMALCGGGIAAPLTARGRFETGLMARRSGSGAIEVLGPAKSDWFALDDAIIPAAIVDAAIGSVSGVADHVSFPHPEKRAERVVTFVVFSSHVNRFQVGARIAKRLRDAFGDTFDAPRIWPVDEIPRLANGAPDRFACQNAVREAAARLPTD